MARFLVEVGRTPVTSISAWMVSPTTTGAKIADLLFALNADSGTTLVLVTHDRTLAARCGRSVIMEAGLLTSG